MAKLFVGTSGLDVIVETGLAADYLAQADSVAMRVLRPSNAVAVWDASIVGGTGKISHTLELGDVDEDGTYKLQAVITIFGGTRYGDTVKFAVAKEFA